MKRLAHWFTRHHKSIVATSLSLLLAGSLMVSVTGCKSMTEAGQAVVTINDDITVSRSDYNKLFDTLVTQANLDPRKLVSAPKDSQEGQLVEQIKQYALNKLIFSAIVENAAKQADVTVSDDEVKTFRDEQLEAIGGEDALQVVLDERDITESTFNESLKEQLLVQKFVDKKLAPPTITEPLAQQFYNGNKQLFYKPQGVKASHILLKAVPGEIKGDVLKKSPNLSTTELDAKIAEVKQSKKAEAEKLLAQVTQKPDTFEALAKKHSEDKLSQIKGGQLDALYKATTDPAFWQTATQTKPGTIAPKVVESSYGYHVIRVDELTQPHQQPFAAVKEDIVRVLQQQQRQQALQQWVTKERKDLKLEFAEGYAPAGHEQADKKATAGTDADLLDNTTETVNPTAVKHAS